MKISQRKIRKAKNILAKAELQKTKEEDQKKVERELYDDKRKEYEENLKKLSDRYVSEMVLTFKEYNKPKFRKGEQVILNWYAPPNSWEGNIRSNLSPGEKKLGPIYIIILKSWVDTAYMDEFISECDRYNLFTKENLSTYYRFADKVDQLRKTRGQELPWVGWEYSFRALNEKIKLPTYGLREINFIKIGTPEAKIVKELWEYELAKVETQAKIDELTKKVQKFEAESKALAKISTNFYVGL